ncbi:MAG: AsmA family protein, partial [Alphaproteobacteria bacterium]
ASAALAASSAAVKLDGLVLELGQSRATGSVDITLDKIPRARAALAFGLLDLDQILAPGQAPGQAEQAARSEIAPAAPAGAPAAPVVSSFELPKDIEATLEASIDALTYKGSLARRMRIEATLERGALKLKTFSAELPGGGALSLAGVLTADDGRPRFEGRTEVAADDVRTLLKSAGVDFRSIPADRLRKFTLETKVVAGKDEIRLTDTVATLDSTRLSGGATLALRARPAFGLSVVADKINLDGYLPSPAAPAAGGSEDGGVGAKSEAGGKAAESSPLAPLAALEGFDASVRARVERLTLEGNQVTGLTLDGTLYNGAITIRELALEDLAGASARLSGSASGFRAQPTVKANLDLRASDVPRLLRTLGLGVPVPAAKLSPLALTGAVDTNGEAVSLDLKLALAKAELAVKGRATNVMERPQYDLALDMSHPDLGALVTLFSPGSPMPGLGPATLSAKVKGKEESAGHTATVDAGLKALGGTISAAGELAGLGAAPRYDLKLAADFPDAIRLVRAFSPEFRPAAETVGGLRASIVARGDPQAIDLPEIAARVGPIALDGKARWSESQGKPKLVASLRSNEVVLDPLLPPKGAGIAPVNVAPAAGAGPAPAGASGKAAGPAAEARWSKEPFDLSALGDLDAEIAWTAPLIANGPYRIVDPALEVAITGGVLDVRKFTGRLFEGALEVTARLGDPQSPRAAVSVLARDMDAAQLLAAAGVKDRVSGRLSLTAALEGLARSEHELVNTLGGKGAINGPLTIQVKRGEQAGAILLGALGARVSALQGFSGMLESLLSAFGGEQGMLTGTFAVDKGVVRTTDTKFDSPRGMAALAGQASLPAWVLDGEAKALNKSSPEPPLLVVRATGPLDEPNLKFSGRALQAGGEGAVGVLKQLVPGLGGVLPQPPTQSAPTQSAPGQPAPTQQPKAPASPSDFIKGILKGLGQP